MKNSNDTKIYIPGKVSNSIAKKIKSNYTPSSQHLWLFAGYCFHEFSVGSVFDIFVEQATQNWNHDFKIKLVEVFDEFGRSHTSIPVGYKTICLFEFYPSIPAKIKKLPTLKTWKVGNSGIYLCDHSTIDLLNTPLENNLIFRSLSSLLFSNLSKQNKKSFSFNDIANILPKESSNLIIDNLLISGKLKKENDLLILAEQD